MELDFSQMALELSHHSYLLVTHLTTQEHCCHTSFHAYWYMNVMWSSRLFRVSLFLENASILMIWGCFSIVSNVIRSNYCCRRHTMHGNMVFSRDSIFPTPQQSGCLCVCSVDMFWDNFQKVAKYPNLTFFGPFEINFRMIQSNPSLGSWLVPSLGSFISKYRKNYQPI